MRMPDAVAKAVNAQITMEFASFYLYLAMAAYFERTDLPGFAHWMRRQADEERAHAMRLFEFMVQRKARIELGALTAPPDSFGSPRQAIEQVAAHEAKVTMSIHALFELAAAHKDHPTAVHLHWFIDEQVEEEKQTADLLGRLRLVEQGQGDLLTIDQELARRDD